MDQIDRGGRSDRGVGVRIPCRAEKDQQSGFGGVSVHDHGLFGARRGILCAVYVIYSVDIA